MKEIRIHGRGGQGSVTAAGMLAISAFYDGKFSQAFPNFGVERRGAPVTAYTRISDKFIRLRSQVYHPDFIIVQDPTLLAGVDVCAGAKEKTVLLINTEKELKNFKSPKGVIIKTVPATPIALKIIGKPIVNTVLLGAFSAISGLVSLKAVEKAIRERFSEEIAEVNVLAAKKGYKIFKNKSE